MWSSVANLKENLNKIALDVHDDDDYDDDELSLYNSSNGNGNSNIDRRFSHSFARSRSPTHSPSVNGFDSPYKSEIEQYKTEIKRLQESEAEIKALSVNYAALLKEKEDQMSRLNEENSSLKQNLHAANAARSPSRNILKGSNDQSSNRQNRGVGKNRSQGSPTSNGSHPDQDRLGNGIRNNDKELADMLEEKNRSLAEIQSTYEAQVKDLRMELDKERGKSASMQLRLHEEEKLHKTTHQELNFLKANKEELSTEMMKIQDDLNNKSAEIRQLQVELENSGNEGPSDSAESLKRVITILQKENNDLKEKQSPENFPGKEKLELSLQKLEKDVSAMRLERDKAVQQLNRLKQHLLEKESEESEKMDQDTQLIEELREMNNRQRAQILNLERALTQANAKYEEAKGLNTNEVQKSKETIDQLTRKLSSCMSTIEAKNVEILNLQTALGQYYAEIEAKEQLGEDLHAAKEESARLLDLVKDAHEQTKTAKRENEELSTRLSQFEKALVDGKNRVKKLDEDNEKLRRALEQSMTRLNRMSMDSDNNVDRRIVIKLLVTYFQRNHSKEVLDLIVRMLGFSDEDKQRIGVAQKGASKGVVRGVLGFPGRLVGGIIGGGSGEASSNVASENQTFADLWVDFLLKETEERERRESEAAAKESNVDQSRGSPDSRMTTIPDQTGSLRSSPLDQSHGPMFSHGNLTRPGQSDSEFSTVPLTSSESSSQFSRMPMRY